jgi:hypothetical protein
MSRLNLQIKQAIQDADFIDIELAIKLKNF